MALGQPENRLTVIVRYPTGKMRVHLHEVLTRTNKRCRLKETLTHEEGFGVDYPLSYCRRLFRLMAQWLTEEDLGQVDQFIRTSNNNLYKEWTDQRALIGR